MPAAYTGQPYVVCAAGPDQIASSSDCDCDCACAPAPSPASLEPPSLLAAETRYVAAMASLPLDGDHVVAYNPRAGIAVLSKAGHALATRFQDPCSIASALETLPAGWEAAMAEETLVRLIGLGLLRPAGAPLPPIDDTPAALTAWLHITDRCNLRCTYCYLPHMPLDMTPEVGRGAIDASMRSALDQGFSKVKLKYAGGEALLRLDLIAELHSYAIGEASRLGLALDGVVLSNGTLLSDAAIATLKRLGLRLMISLDGLGAAHDQQRPYASGRGSFQAVEQAVARAQAAGLTPDISITVTGASVGGLAALVAWVLERDLPFSLNFYRESDLSASHEELLLEERRIVEGMLAAYRVIAERVPRRSLLGSLVDKASLAGPHAHPCSAGRGYLVFDHKGRVSSCQMQLGQRVAPAVSPGTLWLGQGDTRGFQNPHVDEKEGCRDCEWRYWCAGGCPVATKRATGRHDLRSPNCAIYKALFPEAVRLEGMRLLKYYLKEEGNE